MLNKIICKRILASLLCLVLGACSGIRTGDTGVNLLANESSNSLASKFRYGNAIKIVVIGNSIGCAQTANDASGNPVNPEATQIHGGPMFKKVLGTTADGSANPNFTGTYPAKGWVNQLYSYLKNKNSNNILINESGSGWDTGDHLGGISPNSFGAIPENTINKIIHYCPVNS